MPLLSRARAAAALGASRSTIAAVGLALCLMAPAAWSQSYPPDFVQETVATGFSQPTSFDFLPDGRVLVGEKAGRVRVLNSVNGGSIQSQVTIDLRSEVNAFQDRGLESVVAHPDFPSQPYIYLLYVYDHPGATADANTSRTSRLSRVEVTTTGPLVAVPGTMTTILGTASTAANANSPACESGGVHVRDCVPTDGVMHMVGQAKFAADGSLYVTNGDGYNNIFHPNTVRTLDLDSLSGKLLRIDPSSGNGYPDNPYFDGDVTSNRSKVVSYGLRSPYRLAFHPTTGEPYIGDVGLVTWEEINVGREKNFGWPCYEGGSGVNAVQTGFSNLPECQALYSNGLPAPADPAAYAYWRLGSGASVIGGDFYTGNAYPIEYRDVYFFGDYSQRWLRTMDDSGTVTTFASNVPRPVQIGMGPDGMLYFISVANGRLYRIRYTGEVNAPPEAVATATPDSGPAPLQVFFTGSASTDPDGDPLTYAWDFGDGQASSLDDPIHTYLAGGAYTATLTVTDTEGESDVASLVVSVGNSPPAVSIVSPADGTVVDVGEVVGLEAVATDAEDGTLVGGALSWTGILHHDNHQHFDVFSATGNAASLVYPDHDDNSHLEVCVTATDSGGLESTACIDVLPREVTLTLATQPAGLTLSYNGTPQVTPFSVVTYVGGTRQIGAATTQTIGGDDWYFASWSDGGVATHDVVIGTSAATIVAGYLPVDPATAPDGSTSGSGVNAEYFGNGDLSGSALERLEPQIAFSWGTGSPDPTIPADDFSARWQGWLWPGATSSHDLRTVTNNGVRLWIDGQLVIDDWRNEAPWLLDNVVTVELTQDVPVHLRMEFFEGTGGAEASLLWSAPGLPEQVVATAALYPSSAAPPPTGSGLAATYFDNDDLSGSTVQRIDPVVDFAWGAGSPAPEIGADTFSARWTGWIEPEFSETYTLSTVANNGVRLWVDGAPVIDRWSSDAPWPATDEAAVTLTAGALHAIRLEYFEAAGGAEIHLLWESASQPSEVVPSQRLHPGTTSNSLPMAALTASPLIGVVPLTVTFDASGSSDPDGDALTYTWDFGDGAVGTGVSPIHTYTSAGTFDAVVTVSDPGGLTDSAQVSIVAGADPGPGEGTGLSATYFDEQDLSGAEVSRLDPLISFAWGTGSPDPAIGPDTFSARWTGWIRPAFDEAYDLTLVANNGVRLWIDGALVIDRWTDAAPWPATSSATLPLVAEQLHAIRLEYFDAFGGADVELSWSSPSQSSEPIPTTRLFPSRGGDAAPQAVTSGSTATGTIPLTVAFDGSASFDPEGSQLEYRWDFGEGTQGPGAQPSHTFTLAGRYEVKLTVTDEAGASDTSTWIVDVLAPGTAPVATIATPANGQLFVPGSTVFVTGSALDAQDGDLPAEALRWSVDVVYGVGPSAEVRPLEELWGTGGSFVFPNASGATVRICLEATDSTGYSDAVCRHVTQGAGGEVIFIDGFESGDLSRWQ